MPHYVRHLKEGLVVPNTSVKVVKDDGACLMFDGRRGFGRRVAGEAMAVAMARVRETGVAVVTLANSHHVGRVGAYGELATAAGLVSLHFVNVVDHVGLVAPFRGSDARFSTNPVCIGMPGTATQPPLLLDMATSGVAMGKVAVAKRAGKKLPDGNLIDAHGGPTNDPEVMYQEPRGSLLPFGAHKGYALAVLTELLAGAMSGGGTIQPENPRRGGVVNNMFSVLVDPARRAGVDWMRREVDGFVGYREGLAAERSGQPGAGAGRSRAALARGTAARGHPPGRDHVGGAGDRGRGDGRDARAGGGDRRARRGLSRARAR
jgi:uncharacterized oxidoreductase